MVLSFSGKYRPSPCAHTIRGRGLAPPHTHKASLTRGQPGWRPTSPSPCVPRGGMAPSPGPMGVAEFLSFREGTDFGYCPERGGAPCRGRGCRSPRRGRCRPCSPANRRRAWGGRGNQAFFPSARDQSGLYKLELLPPSDELARPRRYPAAPAPGAGAVLTLYARDSPLPPPRPPSLSRTRRDPIPKPTLTSVVKRPWRKHDLRSTSLSVVQRINWGRGRRKHRP